MNPAEVPSRRGVRQVILDLLSGAKSREAVAEWAGAWVRMDDPDVDDPVVWEALRELAGADLRVNPTDYLHTEADFHEWLDKVEDGIDEDGVAE